MALDQLFCMRVFTRVVEQTSFVRAAEDLEVSKATVTTAVAQLEKRLGTRLLHRTTRRLSLTDEGRTYYASCVRILDEVSEANDVVTSARVAAKGRLRVSVPEAFTHVLFVGHLPRFLQRHPGLSVELVITDRAVDLVEEGIDCAARAIEVADDSTLVARHIAQARWITCASPRYLATHGVPARIEDLERHNCIRFVSPSTNRVRDWRFEDATGPRTFTPSGSLGVTSISGVISSAIAGIGIAQLPDPVIFHHIRSGELAPLLLDHLAAAPSFAVVYPSNRYLTAKVKAFADFFAEIYPARGWWPEIIAHARTGPHKVRGRVPRRQRAVAGARR
jgi:LysR family transcriptional regulator for bpeEF and oprC